MATIGTFTKTSAGFNGTIQTLNLKAKVTITPVKKSSDAAPDYRVYIDRVEIGASWTRTSQGERPKPEARREKSRYRVGFH